MNRDAEHRPRPPLPEGPFLVVGLARSGAAVARMLVEQGKRVLGADSGHPEEAEGLASAGVEVSLGVDGTELLDEVATVVKSPGVPQTAPAVVAARERGLEVTGELELAWRAIPNRSIAVTGTNGKTTTTELIGHIHRSAGLPVAVAGNVGTPLASLAGKVEAEVTVICECSSFQLEDTEEFAPEIAVLLNVAPDHLDRHPTMEDYLQAKLRIFANQTPDDVAIYNAAEPMLRDRELPGRARRVPFDPAAAGPAGLRLLGRHNAENAIAAATAAREAGIDEETVAEALASFDGVPHRLERIREVGGVLYVNDSKATNVAAAVAAIESFDEGVHVILGGSSKGETFERLADPLIGRAKAAYLIGEAAPRLAEDLVAASRAGVELLECGTLERAVQSAAGRAQPGDVVLLAPACASFDQFRDFEERGDRFRELVEGLS